MKPKLYIYLQPNYLHWTAIEVLHAVRQSRTSSQILFVVCLNKKQALTGGKSLACEDKSSINSKGSKTFSHDLVDAISDKTNIKIMLVKNTTDEYGNKKIIDGGYTTYDSEKKEASIAINPQTAYYTDADSGDIRQTSACVVLIHELSGHLLPQIHKENGNAVEKENKIRQEIGLPLRKEDKTHVCF